MARVRAAGWRPPSAHERKHLLIDILEQRNGHFTSSLEIAVAACPDVSRWTLASDLSHWQSRMDLDAHLRRHLDELCQIKGRPASVMGSTEEERERHEDLRRSYVQLRSNATGNPPLTSVPRCFDDRYINPFKDGGFQEPHSQRVPFCGRCSMYGHPQPECPLLQGYWTTVPGGRGAGKGVGGPVAAAASPAPVPPGSVRRGGPVAAAAPTPAGPVNPGKGAQRGAADGRTCHNCGELGHIASVCPYARKGKGKRAAPQQPGGRGWGYWKGK